MRGTPTAQKHQRRATVQSLHNLASTPSSKKKRRNWKRSENFSNVCCRKVLTCFVFARVSRPDMLWSLNFLARSPNGTKLVSNAWPDWSWGFPIHEFIADSIVMWETQHDSSGSYAVFTEQGSSASQMTAAKIMDIISRLPGCDGQAADAASAYTQVKMEDAHK